MTSLLGVLSPFSLGGMEMKNRVVFSPLTRARSNKEGIPNELMLEYYVQRSSAGLIISEGTHVSELAMGWVDAPGIFTDEQVKGWKKITEAIHAVGGKIFCQLWHQGRQSHSDFHGQTPVSSSATPMVRDKMFHTRLGEQPYEIPHSMTISEVQEAVNEFRKAALCAKQAGFDGIEVHSANGYLLDQFLQSNVNKRTDCYGGSVENASRFILEVIDAVCEVFPKESVGIRFSPNGVFGDVGSPEYREQFSHTIKSVGEKNIAYVCILDGLGFGFHEFGDPFTLSDCRQLLEGTTTALMGNCGYTKESADEAISSGDADMIGFGRPYIANSDLVERFKNGWELNPPIDRELWSKPDKGAEGYTTPEAYMKRES